MARTTPLLFVLLIAAGIWLSWRHYKNARALLQEWAQANGLRILHAGQNWGFMPLPMWFTTSRYQMVYRISAYDETTHRIRNGLVRLGTPIWGFMNPDAVEVFWDDN